MNVKKFALYYVDENNTLCGSDSFLPLDGRFAIATCINKAIKNYNSHLDSFKEQVIGFRICSGSIQHPIYLTSLIRINHGESI